MPSVRGRERGRFPLRAAAYQKPTLRRRPPAQPLAQTITVGIAAETDAALAALVVAGAGTDTFADGSLGAPWVAWTVGAGPSSLIVTSGTVTPSGTLGDASWPISIGPNCFMEAVLAAPMQVSMSYGVAVRLTAHSSAANGYMAELLDTGGGARLNLYKGSGFTTLAAPGTLYTSADVDALRITAVGTTIKGYLRIAGVWTEAASATDATYTAAGYPGFWVQDASGVDGSLTQVAWGAATAGPVSVGLASTTDTALAVTHAKRKALGQQAETDAAQAATHRKTKTLGLVTETQTAQTVTKVGTRVVAVGLATEAETAQEIRRTLPSGPAKGKSGPGSRGRERGRFPMRGRPWAPDQRSRGLGTWAQAPRTAQVVAVGIVVETQLAQSLVNAPQVHAVGQAAETELAQRVLTARVVASGFPYPIQHITAGPFVVPGLVTETQTAQPVGKVKVKAIGRPGDTEFSLSIVAIGAKVVNVGLAIETDAAQTVTRTRPITQAAETDTAQSTTRRKTRAVNQASETDAAQVARPAHSRVLGLVTETQTALTATRVKSKAVGEPLEFSTAQSHRHQKRKTLGQALEQDAALASNAKLITVGIASDTETAQPLTHRKVTAVASVVETESCETVRAVRVYAVGRAGESHLAQGILAVRVIAVGIAADSETSHPITGTVKTRHVATVTEVQAALGLFFPEPIGVLTPVLDGLVSPRKRKNGVVSRDELDDLPVLLRR